MMETALRSEAVVTGSERVNVPDERWLRGYVKAFAIFALMGFFIIHSLSFELREPRRWRQRRSRARLAQFYSKLALWILNVRVTRHSHEVAKGHGPGLLVGNHLSYVDVLLIAAERPVNFVTSVEVRETPILGMLTVLGGCLYVERRSRGNLGHEIRQISDALAHGLTVVVFPEATSTDGAEVLRFRQPLFRAAIESGRPVRPFCINYREINGERVSAANRDVVCWYGKMPFAPHLLSLARRSQVLAEIHWQKDLEIEPDTTSSQLAMDAHRAVSSVFVAHG